MAVLWALVWVIQLACCQGDTSESLAQKAASILGRYKDDVHKAKQFPLDCQELATAQCIYAYQLKEIGVVDEILWETASGESYQSFPVLKSRIEAFLASSLKELSNKSVDEIIAHRYTRSFVISGSSSSWTRRAGLAAVQEAIEKKNPPKRPAKPDTSATKLLEHLAQEVVNGALSRHRGLAPESCGEQAPAEPKVAKVEPAAGYENAKKVLDKSGPEALAAWVKKSNRVLLTDTTMRDAHQSLWPPEFAPKTW